VQHLLDRVVVVTGAGSGIGRAAAIAFAQAGMHVVVADVDGAGMAVTCQQIQALGRRAYAVPTDVSSATDVKALFDQTLSKAGSVHVLMNNAGIVRFGAALALTDDDWKRVIDVDLWGVIHGCRIFGPHFVAQGEGHIVNTASLAGIAGVAGCASYVTAKFGVVGLSEALRWELASSGVGVTVVCPGLVRTELANGANAPHVIKAMDKFGAKPEQLAQRVVRAVQRNQARVLFGFEPKLADGLRRVSPSALERVGRAMAAANRKGAELPK